MCLNLEAFAAYPALKEKYNIQNRARPQQIATVHYRVLRNDGKKQIATAHCRVLRNDVENILSCNSIDS